MKKGSLKLLVIVVSIFLITGMLAACGGGGNTTPNQPSTSGTDKEASKEDVTIVLSRWAGDNADAQKEVVKQFTGAKVVIDDIDYFNLREKQSQSMSASAEYDLIWTPEVWLPIYAENGWLLPLDDYVKSSGLDMSQFSQGITNVGISNDVLYAMPDFFQGLIMTYNSEWFEKEGQSVPKTADELLAVSKYFKEQGTGIAIPIVQSEASMDLFSTILYSANGDYFDADGNLDMLSEEALFAANYYDQLCQYAMDGATTWHHDQVGEAVRTEKAPFGITISGLSPQDLDPEKSLIADKVGYSTIPGRDKVAGCFVTWSWAIAANSKNPDVAWEVAKWLVSEPAQRDMALRAGHTSAVLSLKDDPEVIEAMPFLGALLDQTANGQTQPTGANMAEFYEPMIAGLSIIATTDTPPEDVMKDLQNRFGHLTRN